MIQQRLHVEASRSRVRYRVEGSLSGARFDDDGTFTPTGKYALCY